MVVVVGGKKDVETVLLHHTFRNTVNALYIALPDTVASKATPPESSITTTPRVNNGVYSVRRFS